MIDAITIQNTCNRGGSTGHVLVKRSVTFTEIRTVAGIGLQRGVTNTRFDPERTVGGID